MALTHDERDEDTVTVTEGESTDLFVARDEATGVASQGKTKPEALAMLAEALELHEGGGESVEDEDALLREMDIDPDEIDGERELPEFMQ